MESKIQCLTDISDSLMNGNTSLLTMDNVTMINNVTLDILKKTEHGQQEIVAMGLIIKISNILYNNTDRSILPLEDGVYDLLLCLYKKYNKNYLVGAPPISFESSENSIVNEEKLIVPACFMDQDIVMNSLFMDDEGLLKTPEITTEDLLRRPAYFEKIVTKKNIKVPHKYPKLVGTLEKCKFVMNYQAAERGVFNDDNVQVFERDFLGKHLQMGLIDMNTPIRLIAELKYDGISVEAEVSNRVISARSRGDANADIAADLTPILEGYKFRRASMVPDDEIFGMKFEAIITDHNLYELSRLREKDYKNARNAIIGLFGSLDGYIYRDLITLVPLATSIENISRIEEIEFMNKYYHNGEMLRYSVLEGNYAEVLYQVKRFVDEAEYLRPYLPFMYDGVVISYADQNIRDILGRENSINKFSIAIKFNALKKQSIFTGYTFTIGQTGVVTPMIHYNPVEFYGTVHDMSSGHSYRRFKELQLKIGDVVDVEYQHDVMCYITKPDNSHNQSNPNPIEEFIDTCPYCGNSIKISDSSKSAYCDNKACPGRNIARMVNMLQKLNLKDFSEESLKAISIYSLNELLSLTRKDVMMLGEANSQKFIDRMNELKTVPIFDYKIVGSIGFSNIAIEKWRLILNKIPLEAIIAMPDEELYQSLVMIQGIGRTAASTIIEEREFFMDDLITISKMNNVTRTLGVKCGRVIRFSGVRNKELTEYLSKMGFDVSDTAGVNRKTEILIVPDRDYQSTKTSKVSPTCLIIPIDEFVSNMDEYIGE